MKAVRSSLLALDSLKKQFNPNQELILPGNDAARWVGSENELKKIEGILEKILPRERQGEFGV